MNNPQQILGPHLPATPIRGYIEGYYGRLLTWQDRNRIIERMAGLGLNAYLYAPKEDLRHRVEWRTPWPEEWLQHFTALCKAAAMRDVMIFGGIAPGLDYDSRRDSAEFDLLLAKAQALQSAGATAIVIMFDDIEPPPSTLDSALSDEIALHAGIATRLAARLDVPTLIVPRIYADEISNAAADSYRAMTAAIPEDMAVFHCGSHIVAGANPLAPESTPAGSIFGQRLILWDNVYCNDYCPRRLFVGPHANRATTGDLMLNGTGMIETDLLLLEIIVAGDDEAAWRCALAKAGVPDDFHKIAAWFNMPVMNDRIPAAPPQPDDSSFAAIETLLWRWKTPLAREWYPFLFGLKHDLLLAAGRLPELRIAKTQTAALYEKLASTQTGNDPVGDEGNRDDEG
ncbi:beta-N-acetylglucosaminidase domain-containing protein [Alphaproteobacteria bacterium LSUCC0719]